ncbi:MAG: ATP synthase F1 subunit delta [Actinomycetota bacterium]
MSADAKVKGYAQAIFEIAKAEGALAQVEDELFGFARVLEQRSDLAQALTDTLLPAAQREALLTDLLGEKVSPHTLNALRFLVAQGRARDLRGIIDSLVALAASERSRAVAEVRTAIPLDADYRRRLTEALERATGKVVELKVFVDPSVIGGVVTRVGDQVIDGSVRRRLEDLKARLAAS